MSLKPAVTDTVSQMMSFFNSRDQQINSMFNELLAKVDEFTESSNQNLRLLLELEFKFVQLRVFVSTEYSIVKTSLSNNDLANSGATITAAFKKRESYLLSIIGRLNEMRSDFEVVSKTAYYLKVNPTA